MAGQGLLKREGAKAAAAPFKLHSSKPYYSGSLEAGAGTINFFDFLTHDMDNDAGTIKTFIDYVTFLLKPKQEEVDKVKYIIAEGRLHDLPEPWRLKKISRDALHIGFRSGTASSGR